MPVEPTTTALLLAAAGTLMLASVLFSRASGRVGIPVALLFLGIGVVAGKEGLFGISFTNYSFAFRLGVVSLVLILFDGGINTPIAAVQRVWKPSLLLATLGVAGTASLVALGAHVLGFPWEESFLVGAVVSSTDAAAVFSVLRGSGIHLKKRVGATLELESGLNDPMAVILTVTTTEALRSHEPLGAGLLAEVVLQLAIGASCGVALGFAGRWILRHVRLPASGLYAVFTVALAFLAFGLPTLFSGSGFLAVYVGAVVLGNSPLPYRSGLLRVHDALAWLAQVAMFLLLGLLVVPSRLIEVAKPGLELGIFLAFVARPLVVLPLLLPFRYSIREMIYVGWVGLRGAVPIVLATFPVLARAHDSERLFNLVFFVVVANAIIPGATVRWVTRHLGLEAAEPPPPTAMLEISSTQVLQGEVLSFYVDSASAVAGSPISELPFPEGAAVMLVVRGSELVPAKGATRLVPGDHVYVFCRPDDRPFVQLMFGRSEES